MKRWLVGRSSLHEACIILVERDRSLARRENAGKRALRPVCVYFWKCWGNSGKCWKTPDNAEIGGGRYFCDFRYWSGCDEKLLIQNGVGSEELVSCCSTVLLVVLSRSGEHVIGLLSDPGRV